MVATPATIPPKVPAKVSPVVTLLEAITDGEGEDVGVDEKFQSILGPPAPLGLTQTNNLLPEETSN